MNPVERGSAPTIHVFTFKEGLLSRLAHDLRLRLERFEVQVEAGRLTARFDTGSIRLDGIMRRGALDAVALSASDRREIEQTIATRVLDAAHHPSAVLTATLHAEGAGARVRGELDLHGRRAHVESLVRVEGDLLRAEVVLVPSRWGIAPYRAMGGTLKVQDRVRVEVTLPIAGLDVANTALDAIAQQWRTHATAAAPSG